MPITKKLNMKVPPHKDYCPVCGELVQSDNGSELHSHYEYLLVKKTCNSCGANWKVKYSLKPEALVDIYVSTEFEDVSLRI